MDETEPNVFIEVRRQHGQSCFRADAANVCNPVSATDTAEVTTIFKALETQEENLSMNEPDHKAQPMQSVVKRASFSMHEVLTDVQTTEEDIASKPCVATAPNGSPDTGRENTATSDMSTLSEINSLTESLKNQVLMLQGDLLDQKDKLASLQKDVSDMALAKLVLPDAAAMVIEGVGPPTSPDKSLFGMMTGPALLTSPRKEGRLSRALRSFSRSPSRSISPKKLNYADFKDLDDIPTSYYIPPSRSVSPERDRSPSRRIEARLAPKLLSNITSFVDAHIQNLELRMASMESSFENYRQTNVSAGIVEGMGGNDLQMLCGLNVFTPLRDVSQMQSLSGPREESVWDPTSCSSGSEYADQSKTGFKKELSKGKASSLKRFSRVSGLSRVLNFRRSRGKASE